MSIREVGEISLASSHGDAWQHASQIGQYVVMAKLDTFRISCRPRRVTEDVDVMFIAFFERWSGFIFFTCIADALERVELDVCFLGRLK